MTPIPSPRSHRRARIEIIPLIDIIFFLLATFVMVSLSMVKNRGIPVNLPAAATGAAQEHQDSATITVTEKGEVFFNKQPVDDTALDAALQALIAGNPEPRVFIGGDTKAEFGKAIGVLDHVRRSGITKIAIETQPQGRAVNRGLIIAGAGALLLHGLLLFGFRLETAAIALPMGDTSVDVNLVDAAPSAAPPAPATPEQPAEPPQTPPPPTPAPPPEPPPTPEPAPAPTPEPAPQSAPVAPAPPPPRERSSHHAPTRPSNPHPPSTNATGSTQGAPSTAGLHGSSNNAVRPLFNPRPNYPPEADRLGQRGIVWLDVQVSAEGHVISVSVKRSSGFPLLDDAAVRGIQRWTFEPARVAGLPIASHAEVPVKFTPPR